MAVDPPSEDPRVGDKAALRRRMRASLAAISAAERDAAGERVAAPLWARLLELPPLSDGEAPVALFASLPTELATAPFGELLRARGVPRAFPAVEGGALVFRVVPPETPDAAMAPGAFGIPSPSPAWPIVALARCRLVLVPGVAFDLQGRRIGHGRGYYDRALSGVDLERCVGLGLDAQLIDTVPTDDWDVPLRWLCTPTRGVFRAGS